MMNDLTQSMKLNHLSFPSADTAATAKFFEQYLGFTIAGTWEKSYILKRPGYDVVIDHASDDVPAWPKNFHVGFELPGFDDVRALYERFKADGVQMETATEYRGTFDN
jgi:catechol 2,3-dioxygenase-like lactoylglutathione lyase family enzyme